ncbi:MAG: hypothetical protein H0X25_05410 [Acidobacteriales bacterium]|nr:hypothetical protein [Terriglobales bacterium]
MILARDVPGQRWAWFSVRASDAFAELGADVANTPNGPTQAKTGLEWATRGMTSVNYVDAVGKRIRGKEWQVLKEDEFTWMHELGAEMKRNGDVAKKWAEVKE